jgi:hypothetical protein
MPYIVRETQPHVGARKVSVLAHQLDAPALQDYPFISIIYRGEGTGFKTGAGLDAAGDTNLHGEILFTRFASPGKIDLPLIAPYEAMTDETFAALASILGFYCGDHAIKDRPGLEQFSLQKIKQFMPADPLFDTYSPAQLQAYALSRSTLSRKNIHWGNLASLYNQSAADQQQAILQYFEKYLGQDLEHLLAYKAKHYDLPKSLMDTSETREHKGNTYHYSEVLQTWLRDDAYLQQYRVDIVNDVYQTLIATAPTITLALAKAIDHLKDTEYTPDFDHCEIRQGGLRVATSSFESRVDDRQLNDFAARPVKALWRLDDLGADKEIEEAIRTRNLAPVQVEAMTKFTTPIKKEDFIKTLYKVEKAMGVQWNKVRHLEDALGL